MLGKSTGAIEEAGMKKIVLFSLSLVLLCVFSAYATDFKIVSMRNQIFNQSGDIKALMSQKSKDNTLLISMFDSCLSAAMQLDAYFSMLGIFESLSNGGVNDEAIRFIASWLNQIKSTNAVSIQNLDVVSQAEPKTKLEINKLKASLVSLSTLIDGELNKFVALKVSAKKGKK